MRFGSNENAVSGTEGSSRARETAWNVAFFVVAVARLREIARQVMTKRDWPTDRSPIEGAAAVFD